YNEPLLFSSARSTPSTGPEALPKLTIRPRGRRQSSEVIQVSLPTPSYTTGSLAPLVSSFTRSATFSVLALITTQAPRSFSTVHFPSLLAVPLRFTTIPLHNLHAYLPSPRS